MDSVIRFGAEVCSDVEQASRLEWLETNGIGGFASSSILGLNTRRYHGLLTAATQPPVGRLVMLSKVEEGGRQRYEHSANRYVHPRYEYLRDPLDRARVRVPGGEVAVKACAWWTRNTVIGARSPERRSWSA
jgi:glycogen debranching enzyme